ncbi:hypothetical protein [Hyphococcus sp.]|uniref:hypothetical protein n=1 Tax=Hyphococcus sp. TaxID=2038636 RepID=UPI0035C77B21
MKDFVWLLRAAIGGLISYSLPRFLIAAGMPLDEWITKAGNVIPGVSISQGDALWIAFFFFLGIWSLVEAKYKPAKRLFNAVERHSEKSEEGKSTQGQLGDEHTRREKNMGLILFGAVLVIVGGFVIWRGFHPNAHHADSTAVVQNEERMIEARTVPKAVGSESTWLKIDVMANAEKPLRDCRVTTKKVFRIDDEGNDAEQVQITETEFAWEDSDGKTVLTVPAGDYKAVDVLSFYDGEPIDYKGKSNVEAELRKPGTYRFYFTVIANEKVVARERVIYRRNDDGSVLWELEDVARKAS